MSRPLEKFFKTLFNLDPELKSATDKTDKIVATVNGDTKWMITCRQIIDEKIKCDDGNVYKKEP